MKDVFNIAYRILFNLQFDLEGYSQDLNQQLRIVPDTETMDRLSAYKMLERKQKNSNVLLIDVVSKGIEKGKPTILPEEDEVFRFQVKFSNRFFIDQTNLASFDFDSHVAVLTNTTDNSSAGALLLTQPAPDYSAANEYKPGYITKSGTSFFKALQESNSGDPHGVGESSFWKSITDGSFMSQADLKERSTLTLLTDLDTLAVLEIKHAASIPSAYQMLDGSLKCKELTYRIKFHNQS